MSGLHQEVVTAGMENLSVSSARTMLGSQNTRPPIFTIEKYPFARQSLQLRGEGPEESGNR
ncbi:MAG: hypothetical protein P8M65_05595 [Roseibacillus sp.]|nr:hypothetical protein [Roseibacillus sp.]